MGKEIALTCEHVSIDYRDISNMSLAKSLKRVESRRRKFLGQ